MDIIGQVDPDIEDFELGEACQVGEPAEDCEACQ